MSGRSVRGLPERGSEPAGPASRVLDGLALAAFGAVSVRQFGWLVFERDGSLLTLLPYNYGDLPLHWTYVNHLASGASFWPVNPILAGERLRVTLVTIHESLADVPRLVTFEKVLSTIRITHHDTARYFRPAPRIAVLALNPHCGEGGLFGDEETRIIAPAVASARAEGIDAVGPLSADTLFHFASLGAYDAVVCMYHDQGLIPLKLLHFDDGVNVTLGLPIIRTSVDHGTAYDLAGTGRASEASMVAAIRMAAEMANVRGWGLGTGDRETTA